MKIPTCRKRQNAFPHWEKSQKFRETSVSSVPMMLKTAAAISASPPCNSGLPPVAEYRLEDFLPRTSYQWHYINSGQNAFDKQNNAGEIIAGSSAGCDTGCYEGMAEMHRRSVRYRCRTGRRRDVHASRPGRQYMGERGRRAPCRDRCRRQRI